MSWKICHCNLYTSDYEINELLNFIAWFSSFTFLAKYSEQFLLVIRKNTHEMCSALFPTAFKLCCLSHQKWDSSNYGISSYDTRKRLAQWDGFATAFWILARFPLCPLQVLSYQSCGQACTWRYTYGISPEDYPCLPSSKWRCDYRMKT